MNCTLHPEALAYAARVREPAPGAVLAIVPIAAEKENLLRVVAGVLSAGSQIHLLLVIKTSSTLERSVGIGLASLNERIHVLTLPDHSGASPHLAGISWGLCRSYESFVQIESDWSYDPQMIMELVGAGSQFDLVIGSRHCPRGAVMGRSRSRHAFSALANFAARVMLGLRVNDATSRFRCWRRGILERIPLGVIQDGPALQIELTHAAARLDAKICEIPTLFVDRKRPEGALTCGRILAAAQRLWSLFKNRHLPSQGPTPSNEILKSLPTKPRRNKILFLTLGGIGDTVLAFAAARRLRSLCPKDHLTALAMWPQSAELLSDLGIFDEVLSHHFQSQPWWQSLGVVWRLHKRRFDTSILCYPANRFEYNLVQWLIHARQRIGHDYLRGSCFFYLRWLLTKRVDQTLGTHNVTENLKLVTILNPRNPEVPALDIRLGPLDREYHEYAESTLNGLGTQFLGIHAGSSTYKNLHAKRWPFANFSEIANRSYKSMGLTPLLFGTKQDLEVNHAIQLRSPQSIIVETPSIRHTAALIRRCAAFVGNDTALSHLAMALDVPTIMVVGPTDGLEIGPFNPKGAVIHLPTICSPCFRVSRQPLQCLHPKQYSCIRELGIEPVFHALRSLLSKRLNRDLRATEGESNGLPERVDLLAYANRPCRASGAPTSERRQALDSTTLIQ